jgi:tetratricopeptide (TPR) repeat protein
VEATILYKGFFAAWEEASRDIRRYSGSGEIEFLPVRESWRTYPSLPLPESALTIIEPAPERVAARRDGSLVEVKASLYEEVLADIEAEMAAADTRSRTKMLNKAGILHARFGEDRRAEESFSEAMRIMPRSVSSYINMANLKLLRDEPREALTFLEQGRDVRSSSVMINALLAKTYYQIGEQGKARDFYRIVEEQSPGAAETLAYIESSGGTVRAADAGSTESLFWDIEEE